MRAWFKAKARYGPRYSVNGAAASISDADSVNSLTGCDRYAQTPPYLEPLKNLPSHRRLATSKDSLFKEIRGFFNLKVTEKIYVTSVPAIAAIIIFLSNSNEM